MSPTITNGERVVVDTSAFSSAAPTRWDVVAFHPPATVTGGAGRMVWIMRVVGLPGDTLSCAAGSITVNGQALAMPPWLSNVNYVALDKMQRTNGVPSPFVVPQAEYFVLGDNSTAANDSRYWGSLPSSNILGKVWNK